MTVANSIDDCNLCEEVDVLKLPSDKVESAIRKIRISVHELRIFKRNLSTLMENGWDIDLYQCNLDHTFRDTVKKLTVEYMTDSSAETTAFLKKQIEYVKYFPNIRNISVTWNKKHIIDVLKHEEDLISEISHRITGVIFIHRYDKGVYVNGHMLTIFEDAYTLYQAEILIDKEFSLRSSYRSQGGLNTCFFYHNNKVIEVAQNLDVWGIRNYHKFNVISLLISSNYLTYFTNLDYV